jgi:hypothetical protein
VWLGDDVTLAFEAAERLPHRGRAHPEELGDVALTQVAARLQLTGLDHASQRVGDEVRLALILDVGGGRDDANMIYQSPRPPAGIDSHDRCR